MFYWIFKILSTSKIHSALSVLFWNEKYLDTFFNTTYKKTLKSLLNEWRIIKICI